LAELSHLALVLNFPYTKFNMRMMKTQLLFWGILLTSYPTFSQKSDLVAGKGAFIAGLGVTGGVYQNEITQNVLGFQRVSTDTAAAYFFPISIEYCILNRFSAGLQLRTGKYIDDVDYEDNIVGSFDLLVSYHIVNRTRNNLYVQLALGPSWLTIDNERAYARGDWAGAHAGLNLGYRHYFGRIFGVHLQLGWASYRLEQQYLEVANTVVDPQLLYWDMLVTGTEFGFGLCARF